MKLVVHPSAILRLEALVAQPSGTALLHGRPGVGKRTAALETARRLNCTGCDGETCRSCRALAGGNNPNVLIVTPGEKNKIGIEAVHQLQHALTYQSYSSDGRRVVIIVRADTLTLPAQNALLKTLEEPAAATSIILTADTPTGLIDTVLSRCRLVHLPPVALGDIETLVAQRYPAVDAAELAMASAGAPGLALRLAAEPEELATQAEAGTAAAALLAATGLFERLRLAATMAAASQRSVYLQALVTAVRQAARTTPRSASQLGCVERLQQRLRANVNPKTAFEALAVELS
jgi:DNA polymerase-3 subunit delta'